jgi:hypothetical protein
MLGVPSRSDFDEGQCRHRCLELNDVELPGVLGDGMLGRSVQRKPGTARGSPRRSRTAKALRISRCAAKSRCACERGGWGRLSDDGPGQYNPDRNEGPWGKATLVVCMAVLHRAGVSDSERRDHAVTESTKDGGKLDLATGMLGASLTAVRSGKALSDKPALEPYRGKPAVRNLRGDDGDVGIIRRPVRAIVPRDKLGTGRHFSVRENEVPLILHFQMAVSFDHHI